VLKLKRFEGDYFYILPNNSDEPKPLMRLTVKHIDPEGEYVDIKISKSDDNKRFLLYDVVEVNDSLKIYFDGVFIFRNKLSVTIGFETKNKVLRGELLGSEPTNRVTMHSINNR